MQRLNRRWTVWASLALLSVAVPAQANVTTYSDSRNVRLTTKITGYSEYPINLVSGTNASFYVDADISQIAWSPKQTEWKTAYLTNVTITIGGEEVKNWSPEPNEQVTSKSFRIRWDTTHFGLGDRAIECTATCHVERPLRAIAPNPPEVEHADVGPVAVDVDVRPHNRGFAGQTSDLYDFCGNEAVSIVESAYQAMNHLARPFPLVYWSDVETGLQYDTVFYINTHGNALPAFGPKIGWTCWDVEQEGISESVTRNVLRYREWAQTQGLPPLNFAMFDTCLCGANSKMYMACLYPVSLSFPPYYPIDRAWIGWAIISWSNWRVPFGSRFWQEVQSGTTVNNARILAFNDLYNYLQTIYDPERESTHLDNNVDRIALYGDPHTRLCTLYDYTGGPPLPLWYEVVDF